MRVSLCSSTNNGATEAAVSKLSGNSVRRGTTPFIIFQVHLATLEQLKTFQIMKNVACVLYLYSAVVVWNMWNELSKQQRILLYIHFLLITYKPHLFTRVLFPVKWFQKLHLKHKENETETNQHGTTLTNSKASKKRLNVIQISQRITTVGILYT